MVRVRLEQRRILAGNRFHILPRPEDLRNDVFLEVGYRVWVCLILSPHVGILRFDVIGQRQHIRPGNENGKFSRPDQEVTAPVVLQRSVND